jgi:hypothetical protein
MITTRILGLLSRGWGNDKLAETRSLFDEIFYTSTHSDICFDKVDPFEHYISVGWREGRNPSASFDTTYYLNDNPDVKAAEICPLVHYARYGAQEGRLPAPPPPDPGSPLERARAYFSSAYYLRTYSDIAEAGIDPFRHYVETGWREKRDPSADFSTRFYLESNPDVRHLEICPLIHYATDGKREGRLGQGPPDYGRRAIDEAMSARERAEFWLTRVEEVPLSITDLSQKMQALIPDVCQGLVVALSHDDYAENNGGIQNVVGDERAAFSVAGFAYLHFSPAQPLPTLECRGTDGEFLVSLRLDGKRLGIATIADICVALAGVITPEQARYFVIHHLLGFQLEAVEKLVVGVRPRETIIWVHDFFHLCVNPYLLRNDVSFCGAPAPDSNACGICVYGDDRLELLQKMRKFLQAVCPVMLFPSESALNLWRERGGFSFRKVQVIPHGRLEFDAPEQTSVQQMRSFPLRMGFLGTPVYHKGWGSFETLAAIHARDERYTFFFFGTNPPGPLRNITHVPVHVDALDRDAMVNAVIAHEIDVAVLWSLWPETFCFTAHEAVAGGAFVVTRRAAGNIWPTVSREDIEYGIGLETEAELLKLFETGEIVSLIGRKRFGRFHVRPGTVTYLLGA